jgi:hypothetical protein
MYKYRGPQRRRTGDRPRQAEPPRHIERLVRESTQRPSEGEFGDTLATVNELIETPWNVGSEPYDIGEGEGGSGKG